MPLWNITCCNSPLAAGECFSLDKLEEFDLTKKDTTVFKFQVGLGKTHYCMSSAVGTLKSCLVAG